MAESGLQVTPELSCGFGSGPVCPPGVSLEENVGKEDTLLVLEL